MGNPELKTSHTLSASLNFSTMLTHANQLLNFSMDYSRNYDPIATSRTEGGSSFLHHYVSITFNYKFDAKKK